MEIVAFYFPPFSNLRNDSVNLILIHSVSTTHYKNNPNATTWVRLPIRYSCFFFWNLFTTRKDAFYNQVLR